MDINDAIQEVIVLTNSEATKHGVSQRTQLAPRLAHIEGDRIQLQQVVLNLTQCHTGNEYNGWCPTRVADQHRGHRGGRRPRWRPGYRSGAELREPSAAL